MVAVTDTNCRKGCHGTLCQDRKRYGLQDRRIDLCLTKVEEKRKITDMDQSYENTRLDELIQDVVESGATELAVVSTQGIIIDDHLANKCREPRCENFGTSINCPPHVAGPAALRKQLEKFTRAIFFRIDVPSEILYSSEYLEWFRLLHEMAAGIERSAVKRGYADATALAGGSCKKIFCDNHSDCLVLSEKGKCRYPRSARPSMSGFGINVVKLVEAAGWTGSVGHGMGSSATKMAGIYGLVLID